MSVFFTPRDIVLTSGRDGTVRRFAVVDGGIQEVSVTHMAAAWVALLIKPGRRSPLLAALFHGSKLVFQSLVSQATVGEISCGGGHRSWALLDRRYVMYIKVGTLHSTHPTLLYKQSWKLILQFVFVCYSISL